MAIKYTLKMKDNRLNEKILIEMFEEMGYKYEHIEILSKGVCLDFLKKLGFYVYLTEAGNYPYNCWETKFFDNDFVFERTLDFRFNKKYENLGKRVS